MQGLATSTLPGAKIQTRVTLVWDSLEHHLRFVEHPNFRAMRTAIEKCIDHSTHRSPTVIHVPFEPQNDALQQPVLQIISGKLRDPAAKDAADALVRAIVETEFEGIATGGAVPEDPAVYVVLAGVRTVEVSN